MTYWSKAKENIASSPSSYDYKLKKIIKKTENALKDFPVALVKEPFENGQYKLALNRAQKQLRKKITKKNEEEIVYLLIASSLKYAVKGKRFEREERFANAQRLFKLYSSKVEDENFEEKILKIENKINKGLIRYQINEE